jgi:hypothetical protein
MVSKQPDRPDPDVSQPSTPRGAVRVQKRDVGAVSTLREKLCADCGRTFPVEVEQKFYLCAECYRRRFTRKPARKGETQVLIQICCVDCGAQDYLDFMPADPAKAFCRACYHRKKREPKSPA